MRRNTVALFLILEGALYLAFLTLDLLGLGASSIWLKYTGILLCVVFTCLCAIRGGDWLVPPALALTALADLFLLVLNRHYGVGVTIFLPSGCALPCPCCWLWRYTGRPCSPR